MSIYDTKLSVETVKELAEEASGWFERQGGSNDSHYWVKMDAPVWVRDLFFDSSDTGPDEKTSDFVTDALDAVQEIEADDIEDLREHMLEYTEADVYTRDLLEWLAADYRRVELVDDAVRSFGWHDLITAIQYAQMEEKQAVMHQVLALLVERAEEITDYDEEVQA